MWSFFGIRRRTAAGEELAKAKAKPLALVAVAIDLAVVFGLTLYGLGNLAVLCLGTQENLPCHAASSPGLRQT